MPVKTASGTEATGASPDVDKKIDYKAAVEYWDSTPATVDGVLGGFGEGTSVPKADVVGSNTFIRKLKARMSVDPGEIKRGMDFGAGIGRVTKDFLSKQCDVVDILEPSQNMIEQAKVNLEPVKDKVGEYLHMGLQDWDPEPKKYYLLWCQWCCGQIGDEAFLKWLGACRKAIQDGGLLVVKENNSTVGEDLFDDTDSSKTRTDENFRALFKEAGWKLISTDLQKGLPRELFPVRMYALKPE